MPEPTMSTMYSNFNLPRMKNIEDVIDLGIKQYRKEKQKHPQYLVLDLISYAQVKEARGIPAYEELPKFRGMWIHIKPKEEGLIDFI